MGSCSVEEEADDDRDLTGGVEVPIKNEDGDVASDRVERAPRRSAKRREEAASLEVVERSMISSLDWSHAALIHFNLLVNGKES